MRWGAPHVQQLLAAFAAVQLRQRPGEGALEERDERERQWGHVAPRHIDVRIRVVARIPCRANAEHSGYGHRLGRRDKATQLVRVGHDAGAGEENAARARAERAVDRGARCWVLTWTHVLSGEHVAACTIPCTLGVWGRLRLTPPHPYCVCLLFVFQARNRCSDIAEIHVGRKRTYARDHIPPFFDSPRSAQYLILTHVRLIAFTLPLQSPIPIFSSI